MHAAGQIGAATGRCSADDSCWTPGYDCADCCATGVSGMGRPCWLGTVTAERCCRGWTVASAELAFQVVRSSIVDQRVPVVVVGGGPSGLAVALALQRLGVRSVVVESARVVDLAQHVRGLLDEADQMGISAPREGRDSYVSI